MRRGCPLSADGVANVASNLIADGKYRTCPELQDKQLVFHRCGVIKQHPMDPKVKP